MANFRQLAFAHEVPQRPADLIVAAEITEIAPQENIAALAGDTFCHSCFQACRFHG
jgi:hypothetical protein